MRFVSAGGDSATAISPGLVGAFASGLLLKAKATPAFAAKMTRSAARVLPFMQSVGLVACW